MATIKVKGVDRLLDKFRNARQQTWPTIMRVINKYVDLMIADAQANAPVDLGVARDSIKKEEKEFSVIYILDSAHGAIQEFGYGGRMDVPPELEEEAKKFKGYKSGSFKEFVEELKEWCLRKGIDPEAAYPIAANLMRNGMHPGGNSSDSKGAFYYPAYQKYKEPMLKEIKKELDKLYDF